ncbi:MAG: endonuclease III domain-containing protein, partial [Alphaproteobacteria bacterium]
MLERTLADPRCELDHDGPWQLLVATILSAQCTDARVNATTPALFRRGPTPAALAAADPAEVEGVVRSTGFYRNKARAIVAASREICERFGGSVPRTIEDATSLPGVARKTANLVLGTGLGIASGIVVDTHVGR